MVKENPGGWRNLREEPPSLGQDVAVLRFMTVDVPKAWKFKPYTRIDEISLHRSNFRFSGSRFDKSVSCYPFSDYMGEYYRIFWIPFESVVQKVKHTLLFFSDLYFSGDGTLRARLWEDAPDDFHSKVETVYNDSLKEEFISILSPIFPVVRKEKPLLWSMKDQLDPHDWYMDQMVSIRKQEEKEKNTPST